MKIFTKNFEQPFKQNYNYEELNTLHHQFFTYVCQFFPSLEPLTKKQVEENRDNLMWVTNQDEFFNFCETSHGIIINVVYGH